MPHSGTRDLDLFAAFFRRYLLQPISHFLCARHRITPRYKNCFNITNLVFDGMLEFVVAADISRIQVQESLVYLLSNCYLLTSAMQRILTHFLFVFVRI